MKSLELPPIELYDMPKSTAPIAQEQSVIPAKIQWQDGTTTRDSGDLTNTSPWAAPDASEIRYQATGQTRNDGSPDLKKDLRAWQYEHFSKNKEYGKVFNLSFWDFYGGLFRGVGRAVKALKNNAQDLHVENLRSKATLLDIERSLHGKGLDKQGRPTTKNMSPVIDRNRIKSHGLRMKADQKEMKHQAQRKASRIN